MVKYHREDYLIFEAAQLESENIVVNTLDAIATMADFPFLEQHVDTGSWQNPRVNCEPAPWQPPVDWPAQGLSDHS